jgi:hypothetical protein
MLIASRRSFSLMRAEKELICGHALDSVNPDWRNSSRSIARPAAGFAQRARGECAKREKSAQILRLKGIEVATRICMSTGNARES